ncbi:MAG TPA: D-tagatose-bisphosphate aldolase, class II, non-catalytic subunit [Acidisarcina sp.]|nr:D-tagatose-bisphosphate aldolase, class II, non-catalytic subunit [Acidisarcina sp.]
MQNLLRELAPSLRSGSPIGIYSVCSAHPLVIEAAVRQAVEDHSPLLIEATSNQVNQFGGYTGMTPDSFRDFVLAIAAKHGLEPQKLILGGDHLGPNPWQNLPAEEAMRKAEEMVAAYSRAGFTKIHLDASMSCSDDPERLEDAIVAERAARLCAVAEANSSGQERFYVIGTEVPVPGGATESLQELAVTSLAHASHTLQVHKEIFAQKGLAAIWPRIIALVVQPGVEFNHDSVVDYVSEKTTELRKLLNTEPGLVFEAHSTDYQTPGAYKQLVKDGFAILKVGPALTFAMREALFALSYMEEALLPSGERSNLLQVLETVMLQHPQNWIKHYHGDSATQHLLRLYSYSDRIRYYWTDPAIQAAVSTLLHNLETKRIPETLVSNFLPDQYVAIRAGHIPSTPHEMVIDKIRQVLRTYAAACVPGSAA